MLELLEGASKSLKEVSRALIGKSRWASQHELIFREGEALYRAHFETGEEVVPWECETDVVVFRVVPREVTVIKYENIP